MYLTILTLVPLLAPSSPRFQLTLPGLVGPGEPRLGSSLAFDGQLLASGAPEAHLRAPLAGAVGLWRGGGGSWRQVALLAGDGRPGERFGAALDLEDGLLAVGAFFADGPEPRTGAVHLFDEGVRVDRIVPHDAEEFDGFGWSVALAGDRLLVGAPFADRAGFQSGDVRVYVRTGAGWVLQDALRPSALGAFDHLGYSVAWAGELALIGAPGSDLAGADRGAVFLFEWIGASWVERPTLLAPELPVGAGLGGALCADGRHVLAGAQGADLALVWSYRGGAFETKATLRGRPSSQFGASVALEGARLLVGAPQGAGEVWAYSLLGGRWSCGGRVLGASGSALGRATALGEDGLWAVGVPMGEGGCLDPCRGGHVQLWR